MKHLIIILGIILIPISAFASKPDSFYHIADSVLQKRGEVQLLFVLPDSIPIRSVSQILSIDKVTGSLVSAYANRTEFEKFLQLSISYEVKCPGAMVQKSLKETQTAFDHYPSYTEYQSLMQGWVQNYPTLCQYLVWGKTKQGRDLIGLRITNNERDSTEKPTVLLASSIHGNEPVGYVLLLRLADSLLANATQPAIHALLTNTQIWICPLLNPDGTYFGGNDAISQSTRYNANSIDLNRNFPTADGVAHPDGNAWQPETEAMVAFLKKYPIHLSVNFHGGSEVVNYPWDAWVRRHPDDAWFQTISRTFADSVQAHSPSGFFTDENNGITDGYDWYEVQGGRQDYATYFTHSREVTIEMSITKIPAEDQLDVMWRYYWRALMGYINQSHTGLFGKVFDKQSKLPLKATVKVLNHDDSSSVISSDSTSGAFFRLLSAGSYSVQLSATGYTSQTFAMQASALPDTFTHYYLGKTTDSIAENDVNFVLAPNPVSTTAYLIPSVAWNASVTLQIFDLSGRMVFSQTYPSMSSATEIDMSSFGNGIYLAKIKYGSKKVVKRVVKI